MTQEALKMALPLLEDCVNSYRLKYERPAFDKAIVAIKEALAQQEKDYERGFVDGMQKQMQSSVDRAVNRMAQPEQEPVADDFFRMIADRNPKPFPLPQRTWVGLTDDEIDAIYTGVRAVHREIDSDVFARAIEAKLKEKNT